SIFGLASVVGPVIGGYLTDNVGWRWVFYVNVPVGALAIAAVALTMPKVAHKASWRDIDFLGAFTLAAGLVPLLVALSITRYRYLGTVGITVMGIGLWLLGQVTTSTEQVEVVRDLVLVGIGLGTTMPLYLNAVQSALPREYLGVSSSQMQFWRNIGGTVGIAILGAVLSHELPDKIRAAVASVSLPPQAQGAIGASGNVQAIFDPAQIAATRAALPPQLQPVFD